MRCIRVVNRTGGTVVGEQILLVDAWWSRLRGFLGRREPERGEGLLLVPCQHVHTFGMKFSLDLIFLDRSGRVVDLVQGLDPWSRTTRVRDAHCVLELPTGTIEATRTRVGDLISWTAPGCSVASSGGTAMATFALIFV